MTNYQNYHKHCYYSNIRTSDSVVSYEQYAKKAVEYGQQILSSVEHGWQGRYIECYELAKQYDLKFLFGTEAYFVRDRKEKDKTNAHMIVLAKNENGRQCINDILSEANISGFYYQPRIDDELVFSLPKDDVWITSACVAGVYKYNEYEEIIKKLYDYFGNNFFLEVQAHDTVPQKNINKEILRLRDKYGIKIIAGVDSHYIDNDKAWERDDYLLSKGISYEDENGWYMDYPDANTLYERFVTQGVLDEKDIIESMDNTNIFLEVEKYENEIFCDNIKMPSIYPDKTKEEKDAIFENLIHSRWEEDKKEIPQEKWELYEKEIDMEVGVVKDINHSDYFLLDYEIVQDAIKHGGQITNSGRGCFTGEALVHTTKTLKPLSDVCVGDYVITEDGCFNKVLNKMSYDIQEDLIKIKHLYGTNKHNPTICTKDHKILVKADNGVEWKEAQYLNENDFVCVPKIKPFENDIVIDLNDYNFNNLPYDDYYIYETKRYGNQYKYSPQYMCRLSVLGASIWEKCANKNTDKMFKSTIDTILNELKLYTPFRSIEEYSNYIKEETTLKLNRYIKFDYNTNCVVGMLYGDGYTFRKSGIALALNPITKQKNKKIFIEWLKERGLKENNIYINKSKTKNLEQVYAKSTMLYNFVSTFLFKSKKGRDKIFNESLFYQRVDSLNGIIDGLMYTDGNISNIENRMSFDNTSLSIINAFKLLSLICDNSVFCLKKRIGKPDKRNSKWIPKDSYKLTKSLVKNKSNKAYNVLEDEKYYYLPIFDIELLPNQKTTVYDLEVENNHSYLINNMIVHNSAVSFYINKLLGFTKVDRISSDVKLYPERFLSKTRILQTGSMADIDLNLGNPEVFAESQKRILGEEHAYPMIAYGTYKVKSAWKLFAKSQNVPFDIANAVTEQIDKYEASIKHAENDEEREDIHVEDYIDEKYLDIFEKSKNYRGIVSSVSIHPCSHLLYNKDIRRNIGLIMLKNNKKDFLCCLMDGKWAEKYKFLKNDLLKVSVVSLIKRLYQRIGIKEHSVRELLKICTPDHKVWDVYKNGWTIGINQVEQQGTSARCMKYKPTNISELCSFVAAIRPGFKSMYKKYENREDFAYNISTIDNLIRTPQFPQSYMLYQEHAMAILNYAGIPMDLTYEIIKNIAKKRADKVLSYKDKFLKGMKERIIEQEHENEKEAEHIAHMTWQIIEDSVRYNFNAAHSLSVAIDSLYCAYLKVTYPLEFYETYIKVMTEENKKDKVILAQNEATSAFGIKFSPFKFGEDNRDIHANPKKNEITNSLQTVKHFSKKAAESLYDLRGDYDYFVDVLMKIKNNSNIIINSRHIDILIKLDYFDKFGNAKELLRICEVFSDLKGGDAKTISKENIKESFMIPLLEKHGTDKGVNGNILKTYKIDNCLDLLHDCEKYIKQCKIADFSDSEKAKVRMEYLGYLMPTGKEEDRPKLYISKIYPIYRKKDGKLCGYNLFATSIGSSKQTKYTIWETTRKKCGKFNENDIIKCFNYKKENGSFTITDYSILT